MKHHKDDSKVHTFRNAAILVRLNGDIYSKENARYLSEVLKLEGQLHQPQNNSKMGC